MLVAFSLTLVPETADAVGLETISKGLRSTGVSLAKKGTDTAGTVVLIYVIFWVLQSILMWLLGFASSLLDTVFLWNVDITTFSSFLPTVIEAWGVMRDIANALLILIILWIAITIVLNIEHLGGRKLLIRVIIVALLVNFSYAIVNTVFGFTNFLAQPFRNAIGSSVGDVIVNNTQIHNVFTLPNQTQIDEITKKVADGTRSAPEEKNTKLASLLWPFGGVQEARADFGLTLLVSALIFIGGALLGFGIAASTVWLLWDLLLNLIVGDIFLFLVVFAMLTAGLVLLYRLVAWALITIFAPLALLLYATPGGGQYWNKWLNYLVRWAFYAPAFYFLFWLSLLMLQNTNLAANVQRTPGLQTNPDALIPIVLFLVLLFASIKAAHFMGIAVADKFVGWGKGLGMGAFGFARGLSTGRPPLA